MRLSPQVRCSCHQDQACGSPNQGRAVANTGSIPSWGCGRNFMFKHECIRDNHQIVINVHDLKFQVRLQNGWSLKVLKKKRKKVSINKTRFTNLGPPNGFQEVIKLSETINKIKQMSPCTYSGWGIGTWLSSGWCLQRMKNHGVDHRNSQKESA